MRAASVFRLRDTGGLDRFLCLATVQMPSLNHGFFSAVNVKQLIQGWVAVTAGTQAGSRSILTIYNTVDEGIELLTVLLQSGQARSEQD